ncbi:hypothetical protein A2866_02650 [Candidatus Roizmanbacteria bacterium RIFCSPHIGHO2_01_FULL_39_8]|uniref:Uncharacterized protein n=2 Tax=Candidatus Roizmaniibacteriota TaxID=1752723 RepID=A0A1F7GQ61_9BACT|nr:MAG: hypothetical protein A2866_02650 [Candidatus Roizmanbacteria bacterium RIFCSPHIGHO2_01_FULL_39_8]OGK26928.1 MAG: hypothetical protein A3C28_06250 [Candidatus Roizmanbacteria bacterium RIFCSPHIGHO2_02_FULL_39_9]
MPVDLKELSKRTLEQAPITYKTYGTGKVEIAHLQGKRFDVLPFLKDPDYYKGTGASPYVDYLVNFGDTFAGLIGEYDGQYGTWGKPEDLAQDGIIVLQYFVEEASDIIRRIDEHSAKGLYNDQGWQQNYYEMAKFAYSLLRKYEEQFRIGPIQRPVALERAGLVSDRLAMNLQKDARIKNETRVITKRVHLVGEEQGEVATSVIWRDVNQLHILNGQLIDVVDFVNPASGASTAGVILAAGQEGVRPSHVVHRSVSATRQGIMFNRMALNYLGIGSSFITVGETGRMSTKFYLESPGVGDAGEALRNFQPKWVK